MKTKLKFVFRAIFIAISICGIAFSIAVTIILRPNWFSTPSGYTKEWLMSPKCAAPCLENITPGVTTRDQAKSTLATEPNITSLQEGELSPYDGTAFFVDLGAYPDGGFIFDNNIVQKIELPTGGSHLYLEDIVSEYGFPEKVLFHDWMYGYVTVDLLYPKLGLIAQTFLFNSKTKEEDGVGADVNAYSKVLYIYLVAPGLKFYFEKSGVSTPLMLYDWKGYTTYP